MTFHRNEFTESEAETVRSLIDEGQTYAGIGRRLGRTEGSIRYFCSNNGLRSKARPVTMNEDVRPAPEAGVWGASAFSDSDAAKDDMGSPGRRLGHVV